MAEFKKADGFIDWLDQRLANKSINDGVLDSKKHKLAMGYGCCIDDAFHSACNIWYFPINVL